MPYRNVLELARVSANVDQLSGGRLILGVGVGWAQQEFAALGLPFQRRGAMTNEYLEALKLFWTHDVASFEGRFVSFQEVHTAPTSAIAIHRSGGASDAMRRTVRWRWLAPHCIRLSQRHWHTAPACIAGREPPHADPGPRILAH
jgi:alkanesulfonate monooxygenase SsuD/methylene tetrahydromethanopterin reductase-like flavin-dependent oxidoreductase (luciferase family)